MNRAAQKRERRGGREECGQSLQDKGQRSFRQHKNEGQLTGRNCSLAEETDHGLTVEEDTSGVHFERGWWVKVEIVVGVKGRS